MIYTPVDFFIIRTPFYPFNNLYGVNVRNLLSDPYFFEAIFLSSPSLTNEIEKYLGNHLPEKERVKLLLSVNRFNLRAGYRCTPFGLFAGISIGKISDETSINLCSQASYKKNIRLDTHFLGTVVQKLLSDSSIRDSIKWFSNNTIYSVYDKLRFIEYRVDNHSRTHHLATVDDSEHVQTVLRKAQKGATIDDLAEVLSTDEISREDAVCFIEEMIAACLLVPELEPHVTGTEYHHQLVEKLRPCFQKHKDVVNLFSIINRLSTGNNQAAGNSISLFKSILEETKSIFPDLDADKLFQCDMFKPTTACTLNKAVAIELGNAIKLLSKVLPYTGQANLKEFKEAFTRRYEEQEIPLLEVLDSEAGIGYPVNAHVASDNSPLLTNLFIAPGNQPQTSAHQSTPWSKFLWRKLQATIRSNSHEIEILESEIEPVLIQQQNIENFLPDSAYTLGSVMATSNEELDKGNFLVYHEVTAGPSAINLLGRFCHMNEELASLAKEALRKEEEAKPNCIFAEILHIPQARLGNILMRPVLREYEIPILTHASVDDADTISLSDLMISVRNGRIFLRSKRLNKEVIPRLTTAHNFSMNPVPHYHFLCDLQFQGIKGGLSWNWGVLNEFPFLPRVRYGKTILSKARWVLNFDDLTSRKDVKDSELEELIITHFTKNEIPNTVTITQGDNQLPIDIRKTYCMKILAQDLKKYKSLVLQECLFNDSNLFVKGPEGTFTNEIIIPWYKQIEEKQNHPLNGEAKHIEKEINPQSRQFLPGSEWHYVKIYCGVKTADLILTDVINPLTKELLDQGVISKFFFIRYQDPDHHLRIRFKGNGNFYAEVTNRLNQALAPLLQANLVFNVQTEIYKPEMERYGPENMDKSESIFFADSVAALDILSLLEGDEGDQLRWQFAIKGVNDLLDAFRFNNSMKKELMNWLSTNFAKEFNADNLGSKKQLSNKYREYRPVINLTFQEILDEQHNLFPVWQIFKTRKESISLYAVEILSLSKENKLSVGINDLIASYIHMFLNRFLRSKQRMHEMVIYDLLHQHYKSMLAREKKDTTVTETERVS
jgi:thiopeptide-type bacteriocin biosynthesis protein